MLLEYDFVFLSIYPTVRQLPNKHQCLSVFIGKTKPYAMGLNLLINKLADLGLMVLSFALQGILNQDHYDGQEDNYRSLVIVVFQ